MPEVWEKVKFRGRGGEVEALSLINSGSHYIALPKKIADKIDPEPLDIKESFILASGEEITLPLYSFEVEIKNPEKTEEIRKAKVLGVVVERPYPLIGIQAMENLSVSPNVKKGKLEFL